MSSGEPVDLASWWRQVRPRCAPLHTGEPLSAAELRTELAASLAWAVEPAPIAQRFALPDLFCAYLAMIGPVSWMGHRVALDFRMRPAHAIAGAVADDGWENHEDPDVIRAAGLWIPFADVGDKHTWFLCCDRERAEYGQVADAHDDHPWLNGTQYLMNRQPFADWLDDVATWRRPRRTLLVALDAEERVALDPALAAADRWELEVAVSDLAYRLTPDDAWAHAQGAPDRIVLLAHPLRVEPVHRGDVTVALLPPAAVAELDVASYGLGGWNAQRRFNYLGDARDRLRALAALARTRGDVVLYLEL